MSPPGERIVLTGSSQESSWIDEIRGYLKENILPGVDACAAGIASQSKRYAIVDEDLYLRGTDGVLLLCITREEGSELLTEIHEGAYGGYASFRTLVGKVFRQGLY